MDLDFIINTLERGGGYSALILAAFAAVRVLNWAYVSALDTWEASAEFSGAEAVKLRERIALLEAADLKHQQERAAWIMERATVTARLTTLENEFAAYRKAHP